ncbi:MAG TPA: vWA domain-containing protein, partial [Phycisphaerae bacterium]|nr:vWA domain-containing protein [Phycisphaerae bacterium]
ITKVSTDTGATKNAISVIGVEGASAGSAGADMGMATSSGGGPGNRFFGLGGGNAYNVVYVIDGSGSMEISGAFKAVCDEMYRSIARLSDKQTFAVILYTAGKPEECSRSLMLANKKNKKKAADFLSGYSGSGLSNPIPALDRAFQVLRGAVKPGRLVYLLSDGEFKGEGVSNDKVLAAIRALNSNKKVNINTLLFGSKEKAAIQVMQQIAEQNKGQYKYIEWGD